MAFILWGNSSRMNHRRPITNTSIQPMIWDSRIDLQMHYATCWSLAQQTNVLRERCKWKKCNRSLQKEHTSNVISTGKMFVARPRTIWGLINPYPNRKGGPNKTCEPISCQQERLAVPSTSQQ